MPIVQMVTGLGRYSLPTTSAPYLGYTPTIYAAPADVGSGDGSSEANAMDFPTALANAEAGDIIGLIPGVYEGALTYERGVPSYQPAVSGSLLLPIRIIAKYPAATNYGETALYSELRNNGAVVTDSTTNPNANPVIGASGIDYIIIDGIYAKMSLAPPRPTNGVILLSNTTGSQVLRCVVDGDIVNVSDYNGNAVWGTDSTDCTIKGNIFNGTTSSDRNNACIETYGCQDFLIENNTFYAEDGFGVFIKGQGAGGIYNSGTIRYNEVINGGISIQYTEDYLVYQNLIRGSGKCYFYLALMFGVRIYNNTVVNTDTALETRGAIRMAAMSGITGGGNGWYDNILVTATTTPLIAGGDAPDTDVDYYDLIDRNVYFANGATGEWTFNGTSYSGIANWRSALTTAGAVANARDTNSIVSDPLFVGSGDYRLQETSPALEGVNGRAATAGCYITGTETIGAS